MKSELKLVRIDTEYCNFLRQYDCRVPYNFNEKELRPFIGVLFEVNDCSYFAPLSSPKPKHLKMKNKLDFLRLDHGRLGAINFNNMLPVQQDNVIMIDLDKECFTKSEQNYQKLLKEQIYWLNRNDEKLFSRAEGLYSKYKNNELDIKTRQRCCNFMLLEKKCIEYNGMRNREEN